MKLHTICKYVGLAAGALALLLMIGGVISFYSGEFMGVRRFSNFFWFAQPLLLLGIFGMVVHIACKDKE
jgi:hypothetical protein